MTAKTKKEDALAVLLIAKWEEIGQKVEKLAGEFPANKFEHRPVKGARTCGEVVRHLVFWNQYVADSLRGKKADDSLNEAPLSDYPTKACMIEALERTSRETVEALRERGLALELKAVELVMPFIEHTCEHYGQLVVYSRLMGIVPPASQASS
jgi:hypothetical protein